MFANWLYSKINFLLVIGGSFVIWSQAPAGTYPPTGGGEGLGPWMITFQRDDSLVPEKDLVGL